MSESVVSVAFPIAIPGVYDYRIPDNLLGKVHPGMPVKVSVRSRELWGMAVLLKAKSDFDRLKPVLDIKANHSVKPTESLSHLYRWISSYYQCEIGKVFKPFVKKKIVEMGQKKIKRYTPVSPPPQDLSEKQQAALEAVSAVKEPLTATQLQRHYGISQYMIKALLNKKALASTEETIFRTPGQLEIQKSPSEIQLTNEQVAAVARIKEGEKSPRKPYLLYGITGSGKTHVYIELVKWMMAQNRGVIILVPEIALTPQTIQRFREAIGDQMAIIHSHMSDGERRDNIEELITGRKKMVIGVRSAVLAPMENVGLIIVDEEHDGSYKQSDPEPRYHARDVAIMRGHFQDSIVVLGTATPSLETWHNAQQGKYNLVRLNNRFGNASLPQVKIIDMNEEHKANNWTFLSQYLEDRINESISLKRQIILLLNRRGFSTFLLCKDCGHIHACPYCSVNLTYHKHELLLKCHQCGYTLPAPSICPDCQGEHLKFKGTGIQKAQEFLEEKFPQARIIRMDQDTTRRKGAHVSILDAFARGEADILLGTQMVSKGLNFPNVKLVGVLQADVGLHIPDFRSSEKTFQLLTQVAGRAGRSDNLGEVVVQTYMPAEPCIKAVQQHDFLTFATQEITMRRALFYPPFSRIVRIICSGQPESMVRNCIEDLSDTVNTHGSGEIIKLGPAPAALAKIKSSFRYTLLLKSPSPSKLQSVLQVLRKQAATYGKKVRCTIDVDPANML